MVIQIQNCLQELGIMEVIAIQCIITIGQSKMPRGQYIPNLQSENKELKDSIQECREEIQNFRIHLLSSKFSEDTTIQTKDVLNWLENISQKLV